MRTACSHKIDGHWSLSAALTGATGTILVLEKLEGSESRMLPSSWVVSVVQEKKPRWQENSTPAQDLINPPLGRAGLVRVPDPEVSLMAEASLNLARDTDYMQGYSPDEVVFFATAATTNQASKLNLPIRSAVKMERLVSVGVNSTVFHHGEFTVPLEKERAGGEFEVLQRENTRTGSTTISKPSKKELTYYLDCRLIERR